MRDLQNTSVNIVIAGGGTGGHVLPGLAIADAIKNQNPEARIHFVGTKRGIETELVPKAGYPLHYLPVSGLKGLSIFKKLRALFQLPWAFVQSLFLTLKLKPSAILGVGGYASGPYLFVGSLLGYRTFIWEPNAQPGWTNRVLSHFVDTAFIVFDVSRDFFSTKNIITLGMPLRKNIAPSPRASALKLRILVFGGSQGARGINNTVSDAIVEGGPWRERIEVVHQTGSVDFEAVKKKYNDAKVNIEVRPFLYDMDKRYAWADIVICRSGASTVAEIAAAQKCAVFIPFPFAADDHQKKNAESLATKQAATMILQRDFTPEKFVQVIEGFLARPEEIKNMEARVGAFHRPDASEQIARIILNGFRGGS